MPVTLGSASVTARSRPPCSGAGDPDRGDVRVRRVLQQAGAGHHGEIQRQALPGDVAQAGDLEVDVAAEHVDADRVADADAPALGQAGVERHQRRAVVVGRPPAVRRRCGCPAAARRHRSGRGRRAAPTRVRASRAPGRRARRSPRRCGRAGWAPAASPRRPAARCTSGFEARQLAVLDVDEEEARRVGRQLLGDLALHVALDQRHGGQRGQAEPDATAASAASPRPAGAGWRGRAARTGVPSQRPGPRRQHHQPRRRGGTAPACRGRRRRTTARSGGPRRSRWSARSGRRRRRHWPRAAAATGGARSGISASRNSARAGNARRPPERPEREGQRRQQPVAGGEQQRTGIEAEHRRHRQHVLAARRPARSAPARPPQAR